jgi:hypothetical protein
VAHTVILATWEAEIKKITVQGQSWEIALKTPPSKLQEQNELEVWLKW